jgi:flagellar motility protein MotE (MotC chaperone)
MMRFIRDLRFIPIALIASACLLALKTADLLLEGGYLGGDNAPLHGAETSITGATPDAPLPGASQQRSWAQQMFNYPSAPGNPGSAGSAALPTHPGPRPLPSLAPLAGDKPDVDITGTVDEDKSGAKAKPEGAAAADQDGKGAKDGKAKVAKEKDGGKDTGGKDSGGKDAKAGDSATDAPADGTVIKTNGAPLPSGAERAILERLQERRQELDARARELDIREGLIAAAEKRVEGKISELKQAQAQLGTAEQRKDEAEIARLKSLVTMYENMKPRDAAKIFDHLDMSVLIEVASQINPRKMSDILALMSAEAADKLTVELASRAQGAAKGGNAELPKIEGRPATP